MKSNETSLCALATPLAVAVFVFAAAAFAISACGSHEESSKEESYSYQFNENGCDTGKQSFSNKGAYCSGLLDSALNKGCAPGLRKQRHEQECG